ncbi:hypothetical protein GCM10009758_32480 [Microbacterium hatanonis]
MEVHAGAISPPPVTSPASVTASTSSPRPDAYHQAPDLSNGPVPEPLGCDDRGVTTLLPAPVDDGIFPPDLDELMVRVAQGDTDAFAEVYDLSSSRVLGLVTQVGRGRTPAEEVMLDVFTTVWRSAPEYRAFEGSAWAWIVKIALRRAIAAGRHATPGVAATS